jgi:AcrR family transcriptional regulator
MPKLQHRHIERNQLKIEKAALRLFIRRGFHGTSVREIANAAKVSLGNIYNYYPTKQALYESLVRRYETAMGELQRDVLAPLLGAMDADSLQRLAAAVKQIVYDNPDYWRLMYVDVTEFGNRHFVNSFRDLAKKLEALSGGTMGQRNHVRAGIDPSLAYAAVYLQFFTYFLVERLFGGKQHLGRPEEEAIAQLIRIFTSGVRADETRALSAQGGK